MPSIFHFRDKSCYCYLFQLRFIFCFAFKKTAPLNCRYLLKQYTHPTSTPLWCLLALVYFFFPAWVICPLHSKWLIAPNTTSSQLRVVIQKKELVVWSWATGSVSTKVFILCWLLSQRLSQQTRVGVITSEFRKVKWLSQSHGNRYCWDSSQDFDFKLIYIYPISVTEHG